MNKRNNRSKLIDDYFRYKHKEFKVSKCYKISYGKRTAKSQAIKLSKKYNNVMKVYKCPICNKYHLTTYKIGR